jgi:2-polyprenyl-3-methyl-5-hydroxy-6-metoxy-1,4-benzoquinol methylase
MPPWPVGLRYDDLLEKDRLNVMDCQEHGMDEQTLSAYNGLGAHFAQEWREQAAPNDLYDVLRQYFKHGPTVDIGCGSGRDVAWLDANGYEVMGYDASEGILQQARAMYPHLRFGVATLPELTNLLPGSYENVLCETVIMHLHPDAIGAAVRSLLKLLRPSGTLYLSWRVTDGESVRDKSGRLYTAFEKQLVVNELGIDDVVLLDKEELSLSSGKKLHRLVIRKGNSDTQEEAAAAQGKKIRGN